MKLQTLHSWNLSPTDAIQLQKSLAEKVIHTQPIDVNTAHTVAGVDVSVKHGKSQAAIVVMQLPDFEIIETVTAQQPTEFPYIPGLLSFREGPVLVEALKQLQHVPDVFIFDGMGRIHPRRIGIASHMGLWIERPTIGCGKTHFIGTYDSPGNNKGDWTTLRDKDETLGIVLRTRTGVKPVYISPGHLINIASAHQIIMACTPKYRLPEPVRQAHNAAGAF